MVSIKIGKLELRDWKSISIFILSIIYWLAVVTQHLTVTNILIANINTPWGKFIPRDFTIQAGLIVSVLLVLFITYQAIKGTRRIVSIFYWLLLIAAILIVFRFLICAPIEIIHFPQYAVLSILFAKAIDPGREKIPIAPILFWTTLLGILDETNQYFYLTRNYTQYYDFNDFFLNELGASIGLLLFYGFTKIDRKNIKLSDIVKSISFKTMSAIIIVFLFLMIAGIIKISPDSKIDYTLVFNNGFIKIYLEGAPGIYGNWQERDLGGFAYTLDPLKGTLLLITFGYVISLYRYNINPFKFFRKDTSSNVQ
jgi:hypothetical protein